MANVRMKTSQSERKTGGVTREQPVQTTQAAMQSAPATSAPVATPVLDAARKTQGTRKATGYTRETPLATTAQSPTLLIAQSPNTQTQMPQPLTGDDLYQQRHAQEEEAKKNYWENILLLTTAGASGMGGQQDIADYAQNARDAYTQHRELSQATEWDGRQELIDEYRRLSRQGAFAPGMSPANRERQARMEEIRQQLEAGDQAAGNGVRSYSWQDRVRNTVGGTAQNIGAGLTNAFATQSEVYGNALTEQIANDPNMIRYLERTNQDADAYTRMIREAGSGLHEDLQPVYDAADRLGGNAAQDLQKAKEGLSIVGQTGVDIAENLIEMGFDAAVGAATGGSSLIPMAFRTFGSAAQEARQAGASLSEQYLYGLSKAAIETATEKIADGVAGIYGRGAADDITEELIRKLAETDTGRSMLRVLFGAISEGNEEVLSDLLSPLADAIYKDESIGQLYRQLDPADMLHSFLMGAAVGGLTGGASAVLGGSRAANAELRERDAQETMPQTPSEAMARVLSAQENRTAATEATAESQLNNAEAAQVDAQDAGQQETRQGRFAPQNAEQERVAQILENPVNRSQANKIINDPALAQAFEEMTGLTLPTRKSEAARVVMEYSAQIQEESAAAEEVSDPYAQVGATPEAADRAAADTEFRQQTFNENDGQHSQLGNEELNTQNPMVQALTQAERQREAQAAYDAATPVQNHLDEIMRQIAQRLGLQYEPGVQKSINSILSRMQRNADRGRDSSAYSLKDLARTHLEMNSWDQIPQVLALLDEMKIPYTADAKDMDGYKGLHITWNENGIGIELQLSTPEAWAVKMQTEEIYAKWREETSKPGFVPAEEYLQDIQRCHDMWDQLDVPDFSIFATSSAESRRDPSSISEARLTGERMGPQAPSASSSISSPASTENTRPSEERTNTGTPPSDTNIPHNSGNGNPTNPNGSLGLQPDMGAEPGTDGTKLSQSAETVRDAEATPEEFADLIDKNIEKGGYRYIPITNDGSVQQATQRIQRDGWAQSLVNWSNDVKRGITGDQMAAMGALLYNNAVNSGDYQTAAQILSDYVVMGRNTARGLQAMNIIKSLSPDARLYMIERQIDQLSDRLLSKVPDGIKISEELKTQYRNAQTEAERNEAILAMQREVAAQIPATFKDKWTALRYLNMLGNFKTQVRNILGNITMSGVTSTKNAVQATLERIASAVTGGRYQTNTTYAVDRALLREAKADYADYSDFANGEGKYSENSTSDSFMQGVEDQRRIFKNPLLEGYRRATNFAMNRGDTIFIGARYARTLAGYLQANGMDAATFAGIRDGSIQPTAEQSALIDSARAYAAQEAQEATFHDTNQFSDWISKIGRKPGTPKWAQVLSEGLLPFRKTPANILVRAEEYSPIGFVNTAVKAAQAAKGDGNVTGADVINQLSKALTGTGIFLLGMALRNAGHLTGHEDDEKQSYFNDLRGSQDYALTLPDGTSITLDWVAPTSVPLFMGVAMMDAIADGGITLEELGDTFTSLTEPMIQMSMLQGVNDTLNNLKYSDNNLEQIAINMALGYLTQGLTNTMLGQLERTIEDRRYSTYTDAQTPVGKLLQRSLGSASAKTPGLDYNQVEYIDAWGRTEGTGSAGARFGNNFFNPAYMSSDNSTDVDDELQRLYDAGQTNVFPQRIAMSQTVGVYDEHGRKIDDRRLTADEYVQFQRVMGQTSLELVRDLMQSSAYDSMTDDAKAQAISEIYQYAKAAAAQEVESTTPKSNDAVSNLSDIGAYFGARAAFSTATSDQWARDYTALDDMMQSYDSLPQDVRDLLEEKNSNIRKLHEASLAGVDSQTYYTMTDQLRDLVPASGYTNVAGWQKLEAIGQSSLSMEDRDFFATQQLEGSSVDKYLACREVNYRPQDIAAFYRIFNTTKGDDRNGDGKSDSGTKKRNVIAAAMEYGFSQKQATELYNMWQKGTWR